LLDPTYTIRRYREGASNDNPTYLAQRGRVLDGMRKGCRRDERSAVFPVNERCGID